jgi:F0F1-type ATP synthase assembly protein I
MKFSNNFGMSGRDKFHRPNLPICVGMGVAAGIVLGITFGIVFGNIAIASGFGPVVGLFLGLVFFCVANSDKSKH